MPLKRFERDPLRLRADNSHLGDISLDLDDDDFLYGENLQNVPEIEAIMEAIWN